MPRFCKPLIYLGVFFSPYIDHHHHRHHHHCSLSFTTFNYLPNILPQNVYLQVSFVFVFVFWHTHSYPVSKRQEFKPAACLMRVSFLQLSLSEPYGLYCNLILRQRERKSDSRRERP